MKCVICKQGETTPGTVTVNLQKQNSVIIFKGVTADVCENCGEYYLSEEMTDRLLKEADESIKNGTEVEIRHLQNINK